MSTEEMKVYSYCILHSCIHMYIFEYIGQHICMYSHITMYCYAFLCIYTYINTRIIIYPSFKTPPPPLPIGYEFADPN